MDSRISAMSQLMPGKGRLLPARGAGVKVTGLRCGERGERECAKDRSVSGRGGLTDLDETLQCFPGASRPNGLGCEARAFLERRSAPRHDQRGGGVEEHDVTVGAGRIVEERAERLGVASPVAALEIGERDTGE